MSLILRAQVAAAAHDIVPAWPLDSFIAVNPLAGRESHPFEAAMNPQAVTTRPVDAYLADFRAARITLDDVEAAILERIPQLIDQHLRIGGTTVSAARVAGLDMQLVAGGKTPAPPPPTAAMTWLDDYLAVWVAGYLTSDPTWVMPHHADGFYRAWHTLARHDLSLPRAVRRTLTNLAPQPDAALAHALARLGVTTADIPQVLRTELGHLPGWVAHLKWRAEKVGDIDLTSYLAVRFTLHAATGFSPAVDQPAPSSETEPGAVTSTQFWMRAEQVSQALAGAQPSREDIAAVARVLATHPVGDQRFTWQKAYELNYRTALHTALHTIDAPDSHDLQVVMCIDPRSEGIRRHLEDSPEVETFGFAGFFGVPIRFARYQARGAINSLPALLSARHQITEIPVDRTQAHKVVAASRFRDALRHAVHTADSATATPFAFAETAGWFYGAASILRTLTPRAHARIVRALTASGRELVSEVTVADAFTLDERATLAETAVRMMGLGRFAPLVVLSGHGSNSENNLYQSALDCGACGGNPGQANARAAAAIFNDPEVRLLLADRGLPIPARTFFVAAEHNTVSDRITLLDRHLIPDSHTSSALQFDKFQSAAADRLVTERAKNLPGASPRHSTARLRGRAHDWAEVYPELGLAGNAAMVIGPREMTRSIDLGRRVFLHSYRTELDPTGAALETIMTAPLVVAQWINHQYYFSALNPDTLGAGTKTIHNAIGTLGVISGHSGDLRRGLPWQSVGLGRLLFHEPMRLTVVVEAPLPRIGEIISRNQVLRDLFDNDWITLTAREHPAARWHRYTAYGFTPATTPLEGQHA